jgi:hypothetical protein
MSSGTLIDRFGIISIDVPNHWNDDTDNYVLDSNKMIKHRHGIADPGIKSLLYVKSRKQYGSCKFRELRYLNTEEGYQFGIERLAYEVAQVRNSVLNTYGVMDYVATGVAVSPMQIKARHTMLESSSEIKLNKYYAWQMIYKHSFTADVVALTFTVVLRSTDTINGKGPKFYVVGECDAEGNEKRVMEVKGEIDAMLNTIQLHSDVGMSQK